MSSKNSKEQAALNYFLILDTIHMYKLTSDHDDLDHSIINQQTMMSAARDVFRICRDDLKTVEQIRARKEKVR